MNIKKSTYWQKIKFLDKYFISKLHKNRKKIYKIFTNNCKLNKNTTILDIGGAPTLDLHENYLINNQPWKKNITVLSNVDCKILKSKYPDLHIIIGDGRKTNLKSNSFDIVYSSAVIEHVGNYVNQLKFIKECVRVTNNIVFISTPERFFPLDFHTKLPLIHMLPKKIHRTILKLMGDNFFRYEENLNLLSKKDLIKMCKELNITQFLLKENRVLNIRANNLLIINKV